MRKKNRERETERETKREGETETETDRQTDRPTDRQTDRQRHRDTELQRESKYSVVCVCSGFCGNQTCLLVCEMIIETCVYYL